MAVLINDRLRRGGKTMGPKTINKVSLWELGDVLLRNGYGRKEGRNKEKEGVKQHKV